MSDIPQGSGSIPNPLPHHGRAIRRRRGELGISQRELAARLGIKPQAVSDLEKKEVISLDALERYAAALGIPRSALESTTPWPPPPKGPTQVEATYIEPAEGEISTWDIVMALARHMGDRSLVGILRNFRRLGPTDKARAEAYTQGLADARENPNETG